MDELAEEVHEDVIANGFKFKTFTARVRYQHFETHTQSKSLLLPTNDDPQSPEGVYQEYVKYILPYQLGNNHPRFWGWVLGTGT
ncbi:MAG: hypothetical protein LUQ47_06575 [Methanotrichaceae archaeon]|nr:hypothetical protein [Methanotrichaceae archaeon]